MKKQISRLIVVAMMILTITVMVSAAKPPEYIFKTAYSQVEGLDRIQFLAINGSDRFLTYEYTTITANSGTYSVYSLENPFFDGDFSTQTAKIPSYLSITKAMALLTIKERASAKYVGEQIGFSLTAEEYIAATQIAVWISVQERSQQFKIEESSIKNEAVIAAANWMSDIADEYIARKTYNMDIVSSIWPTASLTLDNTEAMGHVEGNFNYYGPYLLKSNDTTLEVSYKSVIDNFAIVSAVGAATVDTLRINQPFYVRFDKNLITDISISFKAEAVKPVIKTFTNLLYLEKTNITAETSLIIGNKNSVGNIRYVKYDSITEAGLGGTVVEIRDEVDNLVATMTTNEKGEAFSPDLKIGTYFLKEVRPTEGYLLDTTVYKAEIKGNGEVIRNVSAAKPNVAVITFYCLDESTRGVIGGSIFEVLNAGGEVVTRIGFTNSGKCANVKLEPGEYSLKEVLSGNAYEMLVERPVFNAELGTHAEVTILKKRAISHTKFLVIDENGEPMPDTWVEVFLLNGGKLLELKTDKEGSVSLSLPAGQYQVRVKGTALLPPSRTESFQVMNVAENTQVVLSLVHYDAYIEGKVLDTQGEPVANVSLVAVDENGTEFITSTTNFEGVYKLSGVPDRSVVYIRVYKAPIGMSGEVMDNRVVIIGKENVKNLTLLSMDEYNSTQDTEVLRYDFYKVQTLSGQEDSAVETSPLDIFEGWLSESTEEDPIVTTTGTTAADSYFEEFVNLTTEPEKMEEITEDIPEEITEETTTISDSTEDSSDNTRYLLIIGGVVIILLLITIFVNSTAKKAKTKNGINKGETGSDKTL